MGVVGRILIAWALFWVLLAAALGIGVFTVGAGVLGGWLRMRTGQRA